MVFGVFYSGLCRVRRRGIDAFSCLVGVVGKCVALMERFYAGVVADTTGK